MDSAIRNGDAADVLNLMSALVDTVASVTAKQKDVGPTIVKFFTGQYKSNAPRRGEILTRC